MYFNLSSCLEGVPLGVFNKLCYWLPRIVVSKKSGSFLWVLFIIHSGYNY